MDKFEQRLEDAADEVRRATSLMNPPPMTDRVAGAGIRWLAFAGGVAVVVVAVGVIPGLFAPDATTPIAGAPSTTLDVAVSTTDSTSPPTTDPVTGCSATGVPVPGPIEGLPPAVAAKRDAIIAAAAACDFDALESLGAEGMSTTFGGGGGAGLLRVWEAEGEGQLGTLLKLLALTHGIQEPWEEIPVHYVWPAAAVYETWEEIPDEYMEELRSVYTQEELDLIAGFGMYAGWRTGITDDGEWGFFVAGD